MVSRRGALKKIDDAIKELSRTLPHEDEFFAIIFSLGDMDLSAKPRTNDRSDALTAAAILEHALELTIALHLRKGITKGDKKALFDGGKGGPLGDFHSKIRMAKALGIITTEQEEDLDTIRIIRNAFAHSITPITFSDSQIIRACKAFNAYQSGDASILSVFKHWPAKIFVYVIGGLYWHLRTYHYPPSRPGLLSSILET
jgi:DNA-binding MltR family transcriptional regulator